MRNENLLNEMVELCLPEVLVEMFMDRIVAKSPNATVVSCGDHIEMRQDRVDIKCINTISVYLNEYKVLYELKDYESNHLEYFCELYEDLKQVILSLLYRCVYDMDECNYIIEDVYGYCIVDVIGSFEEDEDEDDDFDDISILLDEEQSELDAYLSEMSDAYEDVDDEDLPF